MPELNHGIRFSPSPYLNHSNKREAEAAVVPVGRWRPATADGAATAVAGRKEVKMGGKEPRTAASERTGNKAAGRKKGFGSFWPSVAPEGFGDGKVLGPYFTLFLLLFDPFFLIVSC